MIFIPRVSFRMRVLYCANIKVCELENNPQFVLDVTHHADLKISLIQVI